ncbi:hypothetical protein OCS_03574 [Ophiocordyceps sinensis CO18]|uniref:Uncharacterized protein n=1 Tax=Ophiocordyceps sinensis (strain Co18 / CGMCC 3.14243) TaxID=911162 RepID=T5AFW7_OPHSC|nr:hypothetical protein OCS_03574 [Ophiocordyceps sinensis CO18]
MATLASIPEANTAPPSRLHVRPLLQRTASFERLRPRSRVLVLSRRPTRVRNPSRHLQGPSGPGPRQAGPRQAGTQRPPPAWGQSSAAAISTEAFSSSTRAKNAKLMRGAPPPPHVDEAPSIDNVLETSVSSVDLDSFPLPPSSNIHLHHPRNVNRPGPATAISNKTPPLLPASVRPNFMSTTNDGAMSSARRCLGDTIADMARASKHTSIDSTLVEAISRTIVQQIRLLSAIKHGDRRASNSSQSNSPPAPAHDAHSRTSSQREALDCFTQGLRRYADDTGARGKTVRSSPDPIKSGESLRTLSALMPFRPEFRAAGLAVTSKDQALRDPPHAPRPGASRFGRRCQPSDTPGHKYLHPSQIDGHHEGPPSTSINTQISFAPARDMDEWRYALIEEAPVRKQKRAPKAKKPKTHCLPCFPGEDDEHMTNADWAHFRPAPADTAKLQGDAAGPNSKMPPPTRSPPTRSPPPRPAETRPLRLNSNLLSPRHMSDERGIRTRHREIEADAVLEPVQKSRTSAKQGHSQTLLKARAASKARNGLPPSKGGKTSSRQDRGADRLPARSQSAKIQLTQGTRKRREREVPSARPLPGGETWRAASKTTSGAALEADDGRVTSALPCTWGRQDGPIPNLEEEWEKTARLAANTKAPPASQAPDPGRSDMSLATIPITLGYAVGAAGASPLGQSLRPTYPGERRRSAGASPRTRQTRKTATLPTAMCCGGCTWRRLLLATRRWMPLSGVGRDCGYVGSWPT